MFCLRSWIGLLLFLTNCPPAYTVLFIVGNYVSTRPCIYCSLLLTVLIFSLFDFHGNWFESRWPSDLNTLALTETASSLLSGNATVTEMLAETASFAISAINGTGGSLASAAMEGLKKKATTGGVSASAGSTAGSSGFEWLKGLAGRKLLHIPFLDVQVRL